MKKYLVAVLCAAALVALQPDSAAAQVVGFKVGQTYSNTDNDPDVGESDYLGAFGGGGFVRFGFAGLALQLEVLAVTKGYQLNDSDSNDEVKFKLDYIEVPLTALIPLGRSPYIFLGPAFAFDTGCTSEASVAGVESSVDCDDSFERKKLDIGATGGIGFHIPIGPGAALVEGRYTLGLTNINDDGSDAKIRNRSIAAFVGYAIPIGSR